MADKKVLLAIAATWNGVNYAPGINTMPEDGADYAIKSKFGKAVDENPEEESSIDESNLLSPEEAISRFGQGDNSQIVFDSLKFHQAAIVAKNSNPDSSKTEEKVKGEEKAKGNNVGIVVQEKVTAAPKEKPAETAKKKKAETAKPIETEPEKTTDASNETEEIKAFTDDFPEVENFKSLGFTSITEVQKVSKPQLISVGISEETADKALAYK